jgi:hypothetical protein
MGAARLTGFDPKTMAEMTGGEIVRWIQAYFDSRKLLDAWVGVEDDAGS